MLNLSHYIKFKNHEISNFIVWLLNENAYGKEDFLNQIISHVKGGLVDESKDKEKMAMLDRIVDNASFVTGVDILNIDALAGNLYIHIKLFRHAGYPGGETDREMGECSIELEKTAFTLLMSEYFSYKYSGNRSKYTA